VELISKPQTKPFFLSLMFNAPHWPWQAPGDAAYHDSMPWPEGGSPSTYAAMMQSLDNGIGKLMKALEEKKLAEQTIVIFTSDNGGERFSDMGPYKGRKMQLWEGGIRVPAFVKWIGKIKPNSTSDQVVTTMDWSATILALAGAKQPAAFPLDGMDLSKVLLKGEMNADRILYWRIYQRIDHKAMRDGKWKYLRDEKGNEYLFDLSSDPTETTNLREKELQVFQRLKQSYANWETTVLKPFR
jgi:arylsulfatase A-like enzyme